MRRENLVARLLRALSGKTQEQAAGDLGVHSSLIALIETGKIAPAPHHLEALARSAGLTRRDAERILNFCEDLRRGNRRRIRLAPLRRLPEAVQYEADSALERLRALPTPERIPCEGDRKDAEALWQRLKDLSGEARTAVVQVSEEFQGWALCELVGEESAKQASRDLESAAALARLAEEIAARVPGPEPWRLRLQGFAAAHVANVLRASGKLRAADAAFERAKRLWHSGSDPAAVLDPGRLLDLEASLRRGQRRFEETLKLLDEAAAISRSPTRILINRGFTLEVMGEYERAIGVLKEAEDLVERQADPRLRYTHRFNLGVNYCHTGRYAEASGLVADVRKLAIELGDEIFLIRVVWLEGRIAAGMGRLSECRALLDQAWREFAARGMWYDVALALLELAVLYLDQGYLEEVKALAKELAQVFQAQGVHREALAALRLFQEAVQGDMATAALARRVLQYLFRSQHDQGLQFTGS